MNTKELNKIIINYIRKSKPNGAILITGPWGSGKTHYVRNELDSEISNIEQKSNIKVKPIYVSLYGVEKLDDISKEIFNKTFLFGKSINLNFKKGKVKGAKARKKFALDTVKCSALNLAKGLVTKYTGMEWSLPKIKNFWEYIDGTEIVLILDDLERSRINIIELLGYINNFVEEYSIKTLILANEEEIEKLFFYQDIISKYELVKNIDLPINSINEAWKQRLGSQLNPNDSKTKNSSDVIKVDRSTLNERVKYLFPKYNDYETIKEKLIGYTVNYKPDLNTIFNNIPNNFSAEDIEIILKLYERLACLNVRTFIFGNEIFEKIQEIIDKLELEYKVEVRKNVINAIFYLAIINKNPGLKKNNYTMLNFSFDRALTKETRESLNEEVNRYVKTSFIDEKRIKEVLKMIDEELKKYKTEFNDPTLNPLSELATTWINLEDEDLKSRMKNSRSHIQKGPIRPMIYKDFIKYIYFYNEIFTNEAIDVKDEINKIINKISSSTEYIKKDIGFLSSGIIFDKDKEAEIRVHSSRIDEEIKKRNKEIGIFKEENQTEKHWIKNIVDKVEDFQHNFYGDGKSIIGHLNIEKTIKNIEKSNVQELNDFFNDVLRRVYSFTNLGDYYYNDLENLELLVGKLENLKEGYEKVNGKRIFNYVINQIIEYINLSVIPSLKN